MLALFPSGSSSAIPWWRWRRGETQEDITGGLGQCVAAMVGAQREFNQREGLAEIVVHGTVTTGSIWRFLKLDGSVVFIDLPEYYFDQIGKVLGILLTIAT